MKGKMQDIISNSQIFRIPVLDFSLQIAKRSMIYSGDPLRVLLYARLALFVSHNSLTQQQQDQKLLITTPLSFPNTKPCHVVVPYNHHQ